MVKTSFRAPSRLPPRTPLFVRLLWVSTVLIDVFCSYRAALYVGVLPLSTFLAVELGGPIGFS